MKLNDATDIYLGETPVDEVYLGEQLVWRRRTTDKYVRVEPKVVWLLKANDNTGEVNVESNTFWEVKS